MECRVNGFISCTVVLENRDVIPGFLIRAMTGPVPNRIHGRFHENGTDRTITASHIFFHTEENLRKAGFAGQKHRGFAYVGKPNALTGEIQELNAGLPGATARATGQGEETGQLFC